MTRDEIKSAVQGALLFLSNDEKAMDRFDLSVDGFYKSFLAAICCLPFEIALTLFRTDRLSQADSIPVFFFYELISYALVWLIFPLLAILTTRYFGLQARYVHYVVSANWVRLVQIAVVSTLLLIFGLNVAAGSFWLFVIFVTLIYDGLQTRISLQCSVGVTVGLVVFNALAILLLQALIIQIF